MVTDQQLLCSRGKSIDAEHPAGCWRLLKAAPVPQGDTSRAGISCPCARLGSASLKSGCVRRGFGGGRRVSLDLAYCWACGRGKKCGGDDCAAFIESHRNWEMQPKPIVFVKPLAGRDDARHEWRSQRRKARKKKKLLGCLSHPVSH